MPTPTGTISLSDVNVELGRSSTATIDMNDSAVRSLAGVGGSGTVISMNDLRGKSSLTVDYPSLASASVSNFNQCASLSVTVGAPTISGGNGTYTYSWTRTSASQSFSISSTTAQRPTWSRQVCDDMTEEVWQVTVTSGGTSKTDSVTVRLSHTNLN